MSNFYAGSRPMMETVAELVDELEAKGFDVHTIVLELNGQHGEFDVVVKSTSGEDYSIDEEQETKAIAHRSGGWVYGEPETVTA